MCKVNNQNTEGFKNNYYLIDMHQPSLINDSDLFRNKRVLSDIEPGKVPPIVSWIVSERCNMRCSHCYPNSSPEKYDQELNEDQHYNIIRTLALAGVKCVIISGGEPMIIPHLHHLIKKIKNYRMTASLCTNGSMVRRENASQLVGAGLDRVSVSIDGAEENIHDGLRLSPGAFKKAINAIKMLSEEGMPVYADYTATSINRTNLKDLSSIVRQAGAKGLRIKRFLPIGRGQKNQNKLSLDLEEMRILLDELFSNEISFYNIHDPAAYCYYRLAQGDNEINPRSITSHIGCSAGLGWFAVQANGDITPCPLLQIPVGKILNDNLNTIFSQSVVIKSILNRNNRVGACGTCCERFRCGGCRAHAFAISGNYLAEDPLCLIAHD